MFGKKKKAREEKLQRKGKIKIPQTEISLTNVPVWNYKVYYLKLSERILYFLLAFFAGAATGYLFYGGLAKDEFNNPTTMTYVLNIAISAGTGIVAGILFLPMRTEQIREKKQKLLKGQFIDLLDSLSTSLMAGKNITQAFQNAKNDLVIQYSEEADIVKELDVMLSGLINNISIEELLLDFGRRSGIDDIESFGNVFDTCYRKGGNIKEVIQNTAMILGEKDEIEQEIETKLAANKNEQMIMNIMPIVLVALIKLSNPDFSQNFAKPTGVMASTFAIICFVFSFYVGKRILNIKV